MKPTRGNGTKKSINPNGVVSDPEKPPDISCLFSVSESQLPVVPKYLDNQEEPHPKSKFLAASSQQPALT